jgi:CheY-like chemotaxis protein
MSLLLGLEGYQVDCAYDGEQALSRAESFRPEVVLLDLGLPRFSGFEVARRLRAEPSGAAMLLVAVSGYGRERDRQAAREAGFDMHLTKPADPDEVLRLLSQRRALRGAGRLGPAGLAATAQPGPATSARARPGPDAQHGPAAGRAEGRATPSDVPPAGAVRDA